ncbi:MAG: NAD(P)H-dependent oxidoreductase subunit E, partial [Candidatus Eremiobacteraeota bacterium]|nr:NAD(P)H-dependent oxidoreductase subunit E [Candidatus Eremiobacteraeota bacterium]
METIDLTSLLGVAARPAGPPDIEKKKKKRRAPKGRAVDPKALEEVRALLGDEPRRRDLLIEHLHKIQDTYRCISSEHMVALADEMRLASTEVFEVATFYHHFDVVRDDEARPPAVTVRVCDGLSCELAGARNLQAMLEKAGYGDGVRISPAPCIGRCDSAPAAVVNQFTIDRATVADVDAALEHFSYAATLPPYRKFAEYASDGGYALLRECVGGTRTVDDTIAALEHSGLRGLGGAGFPTGRKWKIVRNEPAPRLMAVNIDEGEPGTFKDRWYLERDPHRFLEGMLIAAWAVGIDDVYVYLRDEYAHVREILTRELAALRANAPVPLPQIHLRRGAGAYICGEESAMIESIEGKKGMPRLRPPYVAQVGLFGRPTLEHNMETLYWVRDILQRGAEWFASHGRNGRKGLRSFSVSGRVAKPGVHLAPAGITLRELLDEYAGGMLPGHTLYGYFPGGASGGILPASMADIPLDFDTLNQYGCFIGSAAIIVLSERDTAKAAATNMLRFFRHESCGQCTPCRVGTAKAVALMENATWDEPLL